MKSMTTHRDNIINFSDYHTDVLSSSPKCKPSPFHQIGLFGKPVPPLALL